MIEIARHPDGFTLCERPLASRDGWMSLKLIRQSGRKRNLVVRVERRAPRPKATI
jgi:hypothetical protein